MEVPFSWRPKMKAIIGRVVSPLGALISGLLVSLFLLPCTSGPYVVILGLLAEKTDFVRTFTLLIFYNLIRITSYNVCYTKLLRMLELGQESEAGHQKVVEKISDMGVDIFIAVGKRMETAVKKVLGENFDREKVWIFADPMVAGLKAQELMKQGDLVLIKGSQGMRMEKVTEEIMGEPEKVENLLCRQSREWRKRPFTRP